MSLFLEKQNKFMLLFLKKVTQFSKPIHNASIEYDMREHLVNLKKGKWILHVTNP